MKGPKILQYIFVGMAILALVYCFVKKENFGMSTCDINSIVNISDAETICHNCSSQCSGDQLNQCNAAGNQEFGPSPLCGSAPPPSGCNYNYSNDSYCGQCCDGCKKNCSTGDCTTLCSDPDRGNFDDCDCSQA